jgi:cellulose synthase/poly-beta-1,6-N-acetylglucosamine synthase-like glycosyltransferase
MVGQPSWYAIERTLCDATRARPRPRSPDLRSAPRIPASGGPQAPERMGRNRPTWQRKWLRPRVAGLLLLIIMGSALWVAATSLVTLLYFAYLGVSLVLGVVATTTLVWMLHAWRTPHSFAASRLEGDDLEPAHSFSLIVPARHEEAVLELTLARLITSDHPAFEVLVVVGADDSATREAAERVAGRHPQLVKVVIDSSWPKTKPKALNAALPHCAGTITGVFDAEDDAHPALLQRVDQCFQRTDADIVQAGVQLMNFRSRWWTVHNVLEYYFWFRSRLHAHARRRFIPLGGNTVFIRTRVLRAVAGWDADCLAEDCELGVRLSALGARTAVFYEPELVTREECPPTVGAFVRQRTRWNQGYLQTLSRGYWRRLPIRQRVLGAYILAMPFVMTLTWLLTPVAIGTAVAVKAPVPVTLISYVPALPLLSMLVVEVAGLGEFCRTYGERASIRDYVHLVLGLPLYQVVLSFAAARAVAREARGARGWEKTAHLGLHLAQPADEEGTRAAPIRRVLEPRPAIYALAESLVGSLQMVEAQADTLAPRAMARTARAGPHGYLAAWPAADVRQAGNGRADVHSRSTDNLSGGFNGEPLWVQLDGVPTAGSALPSLPATPPTRPPRARGNLREGVRAVARRLVGSPVDLLVQLPLLVGLGLVQATNMLHWPTVLFDEGTYVGNAWAVGERGTLGFYTYTYGHPPLAWLLITLWTSVGGLFGHVAYSLDGARELMCAVSIVSFSLLYTLARRLEMSPAFAALAVILFALCPLSLYFHRGTELDNTATVWAIGAFVLALSPRRRLWSFAGSGACFAASVLSKETTLVLLPALLLAACQNADPRTRRYCLTLLGSFFVLIGLAFPLYATLKGELLPGPGHVSLVGTDINMLFTRAGTGSVFNPNSVARAFVMFWLSFDHWLLGGAVLLSPIALARRTYRPIGLAFLIQVGMILRPGYLPAMYVIALLPFAALIVAGSVQGLWRFVTGDHPRPQLPAGQARWRVIGARAAGLLRLVVVAASALTVAAAFVAGYYVIPHWVRADRAAMTVKLDDPERAADHWLLYHVGHEQRLIVTDDFWVYLINNGFDSQPVRGGFNSPTVISYWPLDKDPAVRRYFPQGWREFDYIVSTWAMRVTAKALPSTAQALKHSRLVAVFGQGDQERIEIRAITPTPITVGTGTKDLSYRVPASGTAPSLNEVALILGVSVDNIITHTNQHPADPAWWYYEAEHKYQAPLPRGTNLRYAKVSNASP